MSSVPLVVVVTEPVRLAADVSVVAPSVAVLAVAVLAVSAEAGACNCTIKDCKLEDRRWKALAITLTRRPCRATDRF